MDGPIDDPYEKKQLIFVSEILDCLRWLSITVNFRLNVDDQALFFVMAAGLFISF